MEFYNPERSVRARMPHPIGELAWGAGVGSRGHAEIEAKAVISRIVLPGLSVRPGGSWHETGPWPHRGEASSASAKPLNGCGSFTT
jgi:hypothetical protein